MGRQRMTDHNGASHHMPANLRQPVRWEVQSRNRWSITVQRQHTKHGQSMKAVAPAVDHEGRRPAKCQQADRELSPPDAGSAQPISACLPWRLQLRVQMCSCSGRSCPHLQQSALPISVVAACHATVIIAGRHLHHLRGKHESMTGQADGQAHRCVDMAGQEQGALHCRCSQHSPGKSASTGQQVPVMLLGMQV